MRRPIFIIATESKPPDQIKAEARQALRTFREAAMTMDDDMSFVALLDGNEPQRFWTLADAMAYAESVDGATGTVTCLGIAVLRYRGGAVDAADQFSERFPTPDPTTDAF